MDNSEHAKIIEEIGGTVATAYVCEVSSQAVSKWKRTGIPKARLMFLRERFPKKFKSINSNRKKNENL